MPFVKAEHLGKTKLWDDIDLFYYRSDTRKDKIYPIISGRIGNRIYIAGSCPGYVFRHTCKHVTDVLNNRLNIDTSYKVIQLNAIPVEIINKIKEDIPNIQDIENYLNKTCQQDRFFKTKFKTVYSDANLNLIDKIQYSKRKEDTKMRTKKDISTDFLKRFFKLIKKKKNEIAFTTLIKRMGFLVSSVLDDPNKLGIFVAGPTGIGKTTATSIMKNILASYGTVFEIPASQNAEEVSKLVSYSTIGKDGAIKTELGPLIESIGQSVNDKTYTVFFIVQEFARFFADPEVSGAFDRIIRNITDNTFVFYPSDKDNENEIIKQLISYGIAPKIMSDKGKSVIYIDLNNIDGKGHRAIVKIIGTGNTKGYEQHYNPPDRAQFRRIPTFYLELTSTDIAKQIRYIPPVRSLYRLVLQYITGVTFPDKVVNRLLIDPNDVPSEWNSYKDILSVLAKNLHSTIHAVVDTINNINLSSENSSFEEIHDSISYYTTASIASEVTSQIIRFLMMEKEIDEKENRDVFTNPSFLTKSFLTTLFDSIGGMIPEDTKMAITEAMSNAIKQFISNVEQVKSSSVNKSPEVER